MKDGEEKLPDGYDLNSEAKIEKKRSSFNIILYVVIIGVILIVIAIVSGVISFGEATPTSQDNEVPTTELQQ